MYFGNKMLFVLFVCLCNYSEARPSVSSRCLVTLCSSYEKGIFFMSLLLIMNKQNKQTNKQHFISKVHCTYMSKLIFTMKKINK